MTATEPAPTPPTPPSHDELLCPRCGHALRDDQSWCLECGLAARTRIHPPPSWRIPILTTIVVLALLAAGIAVALVTLLGNDTTTPASTTVTVPAGTPGVTQTVPTPGATAPSGTPTTPGAATPGATTTPGITTPGAGAATPGTTTPGAGTTTPGAAVTPGATTTPPNGTTTPGGATTTPGTATNAAGAAGATGSATSTRHGMVLRVGGKTVTIPAGAGSSAP